MWIFDLFNITQQQVREIIQQLTGLECSEQTALWITRAIWIGAIVAVGYMILSRVFLNPWRKRKHYFKNHIDNGFSEYTTRKSQRYYIDAFFQNIEPNVYPDILESIRSVSTENMIKKYLRDIFTEQNDVSPLYCVLGGSGMGKTSFLINVMKKYVNSRRNPESLPYQINLINLANESFKDKVSSIENKKNTILLLDALDENPQAIADYKSFINELETLIEPFRIVVITCRTQFFPDEEHELKESKLKNYGKSKGFCAYTRHYISPFSDKDVENFLRKRYGLNYRKRKKANAIVKQCASFTHRPLLLSYVDDLLTEKTKYDSSLQVYEVLIDKWLDRETSRQSNPVDIKAKLNKCLQTAAVRMYENFPQSGYYVDKEEVNGIISDMGLPGFDYQFKGRSLLNRDAQGLWKFSHKSFLEYFLAKERFENNEFNLDFTALNDAKNLFKEMCSRELSRHERIGDIQLVKSVEFITEPDTLRLLHGSSFELRYIEPFENISILEIEARDLDAVENGIADSRVNYVKLLKYDEKCNINGILRYERVKYITISGNNCSKSFIKEAKKRGVALLVNGELINYEDEHEKDAPIDFKSASFSRSQVAIFGVFLNHDKQ